MRLQRRESRHRIAAAVMVLGGIGLCAAPAAAAITPTVTEYPTPTQTAINGLSGSGPDGIAPGPDGNLWFAEYNAGKIGSVPPSAAPSSSAQISEFPTPSTTGTTDPSPTSITQGSDGAMWFVEWTGSRIGRIPTNATPGSSAQVTEYSIPTPSSHPGGITTGSDGAIWFVENTGNMVGRIPTNATPGPSAQVTEYSIPATAPWRITSGPDGALWFTESSSGKIGRIPTTATKSQPQVTEMAVPSGGNDGVRGITAGSDGALWFDDPGGNAIGRIPTTATPSNPQVTEFPLPHPASSPVEIAAGLDGELWFTEQAGSRIGRIPTNATAGSSAQIEEFNIPTGDIATGIALGPDGNMWFTENAFSKVGRITTPPTATTGGGASGVGMSSATLTGAANGHAQSTSYHFEYGAAGGALASTSETATGQGGATDVSVSADLAGLIPGTTYRYRLVVTNPTGTTAGAFMTFTTQGAPPPAPPSPAPPPSPSPSPSPAPVVTTRPASGVAQNSAVLNATVDPRRGSVAASFDYGMRPDLLGASSTAPQVVPTGLGTVPVSAAVAGLTASRPYYFRVVATDTATGARTAGAIIAFTTAAPLRRVASTMLWSFLAHRGYATVRQLLVVKVPAGGQVDVSCRGRGCAYSGRTIPVRDVVTVRVCKRGHCKTKRLRRAFSDVDLTRAFRHLHLAYGSKLTVRIGKPGLIGKVYIFTIGVRSQPEIACLAPGSSQPGQGC